MSAPLSVFVNNPFFNFELLCPQNKLPLLTRQSNKRTNIWVPNTSNNIWEKWDFLLKPDKSFILTLTEAISNLSQIKSCGLIVWRVS